MKKKKTVLIMTQKLGYLALSSATLSVYDIFAFISGHYRMAGQGNFIT